MLGFIGLMGEDDGRTSTPQAHLWQRTFNRYNPAGRVIPFHF